MNWPGTNASGVASCRTSARVAGPYSSTPSTRAVCSTAMAGDQIDGVPRHAHVHLGVGIADHRLAAESRGGCEPGGPIEHVLFVLLGRREEGRPLGDHHVAGGAGAAAATRMLEKYAVTQQHV